MSSKQFALVGAAVVATAALVVGCQSNAAGNKGDSAASDAGSAGAAPASNSKLWSGTSYGKVTRAEQWFSTSYSWRGNYDFTVDKNGVVHGHAVVSYTPSFDLAKANALLAYIKALITTALDIPEPDGMLAAALTGLGNKTLLQVVGLSADFGDELHVESGAIGGTLRDGKLALKWTKFDASQGHSPQSIPVTVSYDMTSVKKSIYHGFLNVNDPPPWPGAATVVDKDTNTYASVTSPKTAKSPPTTTPSSSKSGDGLTITSGYGWDAHPVG